MDESGPDIRPFPQLGAVILARGYGQLADPHQRVFRHPLVQLGLRPLVHYSLDWLARSGLVARVAISVREDAADVTRWLADNPLPSLEVMVARDSYPRGPAGIAKDAASQMPASRYLVCENSRLPELDLQELLDAHIASGAEITTVVENDRRARSGGGGRVPGGVYLFERKALELVPATGFQDIKQGLLELAHRHGLGVHAYERRGITPTVVDFASYLGTSNWLVCDLASRMASYPDFVPTGEGLRHPSAEIADSVTLLGPVLIGAGARLAPHAVVVGPSVIGDGTSVGAHATVSRSVLLSGSHVAEHAHVDWSVIAQGSRVRAGVTVSDSLVAETRTRRRAPKSSVDLPRATSRAVGPVLHRDERA